MEELFITSILHSNGGSSDHDHVNVNVVVSMDSAECILLPETHTLSKRNDIKRSLRDEDIDGLIICMTNTRINNVCNDNGNNGNNHYNGNLLKQAMMEVALLTLLMSSSDHSVVTNIKEMKMGGVDYDFQVIQYNTVSLHYVYIVCFINQ